MPWNVGSAQHVFAMEVIKGRTPEHEFPRTDEQAASFEAVIDQQHRDQQAGAALRQQELAEVIRRMHERTGTLDYWTAMRIVNGGAGLQTAIGPALCATAEQVKTACDDVVFREGNIIRNSKGEWARVTCDPRPDGTVLAKINNEGRAFRVHRDHYAKGDIWIYEP